MPDVFTAIVGVLGLTGGVVALLNYRKSVLWKRAELANNYLKDFNNNPELIFAGRCLDWNGGKLVLPDNLRPYMPNGEKFIQHDRLVFAKALRPDLQIHEMEEDPRIQIYRTSMDSFLSWLSLVCQCPGSQTICRGPTFRTLVIGWQKYRVKSRFILLSLLMDIEKILKS